MLNRTSINLRCGNYLVNVERGTLQIAKDNAWDLSWTSDHGWRLDAYRSGSWVNIWRWDLSESLLPVRRQTSTLCRDA